MGKTGWRKGRKKVKWEIMGGEGDEKEGMGIRVEEIERYRRGFLGVRMQSTKYMGESKATQLLKASTLHGREGL